MKLGLSGLVSAAAPCGRMGGSRGGSIGESGGIKLLEERVRELEGQLERGRVDRLRLVSVIHCRIQLCSFLSGHFQVGGSSPVVLCCRGSWCPSERFCFLILNH